LFGDDSTLIKKRREIVSLSKNIRNLTKTKKMMLEGLMKQQEVKETFDKNKLTIYEVINY
jgi:hypothetical protein